MAKRRQPDGSKGGKVSRNEPRKCMFCDNRGGLTKEHVWPRWTQRYGGEGEGWTQLSNNMVPGPTHLAVTPRVRQHQGNPLNKALPVVCKTCNQGWMKATEDRFSEDCADDLVAGNAVELGTARQLVLARWAALRATVVDFANHKTMGISDHQREQLRQTQAPPEGFFILVGRYSGVDWAPRRFRHAGGNAALSIGGLVPVGDAWRLKYQTTVITLGGLLLWIFSTTRPSTPHEIPELPERAFDVTMPLWPHVRPFNTSELPLAGDDFVEELSLHVVTHVLRQQNRP